jgi:hypothetical protein
MMVMCWRMLAASGRSLVLDQSLSTNVGAVDENPIRIGSSNDGLPGVRDTL